MLINLYHGKNKLLTVNIVFRFTLYSHYFRFISSNSKINEFFLDWVLSFKTVFINKPTFQNDLKMLQYILFSSQNLQLLGQPTKTKVISTEKNLF